MEKTYYIAEYKYSANLAEFQGEKIGKTYKADMNTFRELFGMIYIGRNGRVLPNYHKSVFDNKADAVAWLVSKIEGKIINLQREIIKDHKPELEAVKKIL